MVGADPTTDGLSKKAKLSEGTKAWSPIRFINGCALERLMLQEIAAILGIADCRQSVFHPQET